MSAANETAVVLFSFLEQPVDSGGYESSVVSIAVGFACIVIVLVCISAVCFVKTVRATRRRDRQALAKTIAMGDDDAAEFADEFTDPPDQNTSTYVGPRFH